MIIKIHSVVISAGLLFASLGNGAVASAAMTDPATGIAFAPRLNGDLKIAGVGVRKKGPIKVRFCPLVLLQRNPVKYARTNT